MKRSFPLCPLAIVASSLSLLLASCATTTVDVLPPIGDGTRAAIALLETTDLHTNVLSYDYFRLSED